MLGRHLVALLKPWERTGRAVALDSTVLFAKGGVWHKKDREADIVPHSSIDTQAGWTKSGWHGWTYGWKLHLATTVGSVWIPLAAYLTQLTSQTTGWPSRSWSSCPRRRASSWATPTTMPRRCAPLAWGAGSSLWRADEDPIRTQIRE